MPNELTDVRRGGGCREAKQVEREQDIEDVPELVAVPFLAEMQRTPLYPSPFDQVYNRKGDTRRGWREVNPASIGLIQQDSSTIS